MTEKNPNSEGIHVYGDYIQGDKNETNYIGCQFVKNEEGGVVNVTNHNAQEVKDDDLAKEQALIKSNTTLAFRLHGHKIVFVRLYEFVADNFIRYMNSKNAWSVLKCFFEKKGLLRVGQNKAFAEQMNDESWFGWVEELKRCSESALKVYDNIDFQEDIEESDFRKKGNGINANASYTGYCELKQLYGRLDAAWDEAQILKK